MGFSDKTSRSPESSLQNERSEWGGGCETGRDEGGYMFPPIRSGLTRRGSLEGPRDGSGLDFVSQVHRTALDIHPTILRCGR